MSKMSDLYLLYLTSVFTFQIVLNVKINKTKFQRFQLSIEVLTAKV